MSRPGPLPTLADDLRHLTTLELSLLSRLRDVGLLLAASTMSAIVTALLLTEPVLPTHTAIALGVIAVIGVGWMVFAGWVLTRKRVLLGSHRIVAGRPAVVFSSVFVIGALSVGLATRRAPAFAAAAMGAMMLLVAIALLIRAHRRVAYLLKRRDELEWLLGRRG